MKSSGILAAVTLLLSLLPVSLSAQTPSGDVPEGLQWAVFTISPENAILTIDASQTFPVRNGVLQVMLAPGAHSYVCESPFYDSMSGEFEVEKDTRADLSLSLVPSFGYVTVNSTQKKADIILDGESIGKGRAGSGRVMAGTHSLMLVRDATCLYRTVFSLERGERKTIDILSYDIKPVPMSVVLAENGMAETAAELEAEGTGSGWGGVNVHSNYAGARVIVNGMESGTSPCIIKPLRAGQPCRITLKLDGFKDVTKMVKVKGGEITDMEIKFKKRR